VIYNIQSSQTRHNGMVLVFLTSGLISILSENIFSIRYIMYEHI